MNPKIVSQKEAEPSTQSQQYLTSSDSLSRLTLGLLPATIYFRNGNFTSTPSWTDKLFGTKVEPVESHAALVDSPHKGYVLINNITVDTTSLQSEEKETITMLLAGKTFVPLIKSYTEYSAEVIGTFCGHAIRIYIKSDDESIATSLAKFPKDSKIYVAGKYRDDLGIEAIHFGNAFSR